MFDNLLKKVNIDSLTKRSNAIFDVFTKTKKQCEDLNVEVSALKSSKEEEIKGLQSEVLTLDSIITKNSKLAAKIDTFLNE